MKMYISTPLLFIMLLLTIPAQAQDFAVVTAIGKPQKEIINTFGKPVHVDNSIPSMICLFYKNPNMVFVADESGIYQADIQKEFSTESDLHKQLSKCIAKAVTNGFTADTVSAKEIILHKAGIRAEINIQKIIDSNKFLLKIEAKRHE